MVPDSLREKPVEVGTKVVSPGRYVTFRWPVSAISGRMSKEILMLVRSNFVVARLDETENHTQHPMGIWEMSAQLAET